MDIHDLLVDLTSPPPRRKLDEVVDLTNDDTTLQRDDDIQFIEEPPYKRQKKKSSSEGPLEVPKETQTVLTPNEGKEKRSAPFRAQPNKVRSER
jgi:hypothetical protein